MDSNYARSVALAIGCIHRRLSYLYVDSPDSSEFSTGSRLSYLYVDSPDSSEFSTGSTLLNHVAGGKTACSEAVHRVVAEPQPTHLLAICSSFLLLLIGVAY